MEPVTLEEIDFENSSFFDSDNFKELSENESFEVDNLDDSQNIFKEEEENGIKVEPESPDKSSKKLKKMDVVD